MPPPLYLGCAALGRLDRDADDPEALMTAALESPAYAGFDVAAHHGDAETALGDVLQLPHVRRVHPRASYELLARCGRDHDDAGRVSWDVDRVRTSLHATLANLRTAYVDTYFLFDLEYATPEQWRAELPATLEYLAAQRRCGVVRRIGLACYPRTTVRQVLRCVPAATMLVDTVLCYGHTTMLHALDASVDTAVTTTGCALDALCEGPDALPAHVRLLDGAPLALGQLRGRTWPLHPMATPSTFARDLGDAWPTYVHEWDARLRARDGRSLAELAVDYTVSRTVASGVVVGAASVAEVAMATRAWRGVEMREWEVVGGEGVRRVE